NWGGRAAGEAGACAALETWPGVARRGRLFSRDVPRTPDQPPRRWPRTGAGRGQPMLDRKLSSLRSDRPQLYDEGVNPLRAHRFEGRRLRSLRPNRDWFDLHADAARALAELRNEGQCERIGLVGEHGDTADGGKQLADEF